MEAKAECDCTPTEEGVHQLQCTTLDEEVCEECGQPGHHAHCPECGSTEYNGTAAACLACGLRAYNDLWR